MDSPNKDVDMEFQDNSPNSSNLKKRNLTSTNEDRSDSLKHPKVDNVDNSKNKKDSTANPREVLVPKVIPDLFHPLNKVRH